MEGPDHAASLEADELRAMVDAIRAVEAGLGSSLKAPATAEVKNIPIARKALVAAVAIRRGEIFEPHMIAMKRPAEGLSPMAYWSLSGLRADRDYHEDEALAFPGSQPG
jgi:N,N'-diacetyllegionaminate synthase